MNNRIGAPLQVNQSWSRIFQDLILRGEIKRIGPAAFAAYAVIKGVSDRDTGIARISHTRLGELIGLSGRTVIRAVNALETHKLIEVIRQHRQVNEYRIIERLLVRAPSTGHIVGELCWTTAPSNQSAIDTSIRQFRATGTLPAVVRYSRRLRVTEMEETYEFVHNPDPVDKPIQGDIFDMTDCHGRQSNELLGDTGVTPSIDNIYSKG